jgi:hypothetical protein
MQKNTVMVDELAKNMKVDVENRLCRLIRLQ